MAPKTDMKNKPRTTNEKHKINWDKKAVKLFFFRLDFVLLETNAILVPRFAPTAPAGECGKCLTLKDVATQIEWIWQRITSIKPIEFDLAQVLLDTSYCSVVCATSATRLFLLRHLYLQAPQPVGTAPINFSIHERFGQYSKTVQIPSCARMVLHKACSRFLSKRTQVWPRCARLHPIKIPSKDSCDALAFGVTMTMWKRRQLFFRQVTGSGRLKWCCRILTDIGTVGCFCARKMKQS